MKSKHSHSTFLILVAVITICVALLYVYMRGAINSSLERAVKARDIMQSEERGENDEQMIKDIYAATAADRLRMRGHFLSDRDAVTFIESLERLGPATGSTVALRSVAADDTDAMPAGSFATIRAGVQVSGPWASVMRTLELSETLPYHFSISNVRLDTAALSNTRNNKRTWQLSFDANATMIVQGTSTEAMSK